LSDKTLSGRAEVKKNQQGLQWFTDRLHLQPSYVKLVPLLEIVAEALSSTVASQKSKNLYSELCSKVGNEMTILLKSEVEDIAKVAGQRVADSVRKVREGDIVIHPGYDGKYGVVRIWDAPVGASPRGLKDAKDKRSGGQLGLDI
jgi:PHP family Zn ribbon phosphoesterase